MNKRQERPIKGWTASDQPSDNPTASAAQQRKPSAERTERTTIHPVPLYPLALLIEVIKRVRTIR